MKNITGWMVVLVGIALIGMGNESCGKPTTDKLAITPKVEASTSQVETLEQFTITSKGTFKAGYDNTEREIFILKDNFTGEEYIGVTDCSLIKKVKAKQEAANEAINSAIEMVGDAASGN